jgi:hypothetical protein
LHADTIGQARNRFDLHFDYPSVRNFVGNDGDDLRGARHKQRRGDSINEEACAAKGDGKRTFCETARAAGPKARSEDGDNFARGERTTRKARRADGGCLGQGRAAGAGPILSRTETESPPASGKTKSGLEFRSKSVTTIAKGPEPAGNV